MRRTTVGPRAVLAILFLGAAACQPQSAPGEIDPARQGSEPSGLAIDVMSFNIRFGTADDGADSWPKRSALVADVMRSRGPDVIGLQEAMLFQVTELAEALPDYQHTGRSREADAATGEATPIFYDARHWVIDESDTGTFWLSETPGVPGSTSWGNRLPRICTWARLVDRDRGAALYVFNLHLDHESGESRLRGAQLVSERVASRRQPDPVVVLGDFNAEEGSAPLEALLVGDVTLVDTYRMRHPQDRTSGTFHEFTGERAGRRIDYVLVPPDVAIVDASIVYDHADGRYPSDHFPVTASIVLPRDGVSPPIVSAD